MDTGKSEGTTKEEVNIEKKALSLAEIRQGNKKIYQNVIAEFDKRLQSRWVFGDKRKYLTLFRYLIEIEALHSEQIFDSFEMMKYIRETIDLLNKMMKLTAKIIDESHRESKNTQATTKELAEAFLKLSERMDTILESPAVKEVEKAIQNMQDVAEKRDKNREQILRDSIV